MISSQKYHLFGESAGRQCVCNALFSISWSFVCGICCWRFPDLDYILVESHKLYKSLRFENYLHMDQLPRQVKTFEHTTNFEILEENLYDSKAVYGDFFLTDAFTVKNVNTSSCILLLCSYALALFRYVN